MNMADSNLTNKYFVRRKSTDAWQDVTTKFSGMRILTLDGMNELGESLNVYHQQWINSAVEDFMITTQDLQGNDVIIRKNVDLALTFIVSRRYASGINEQTTYDSVIKWMCTDGDFYIKSLYTNKIAHVVCTSSVKPSTQRLNRGNMSFIVATISLHCIEPPTAVV